MVLLFTKPRSPPFRAFHPSFLVNKFNLSNALHLRDIFGHIWNWEGRLAGEQDLMKRENGWSKGGYGVNKNQRYKIPHVPSWYKKKIDKYDKKKPVSCLYFLVTYYFLTQKSRTIHKTRNTWTLTRYETLNTYDIMPLPSPNMSNVSSSLYIRVEKLIFQQCKNVSVYPLTKSTS